MESNERFLRKTQLLRTLVGISIKINVVGCAALLFLLLRQHGPDATQPPLLRWAVILLLFGFAISLLGTATTFTFSTNAQKLLRTSDAAPTSPALRALYLVAVAASVTGLAMMTVGVLIAIAGAMTTP